MTKYHIRTDGSIGVCRAKEGKCPYTTHIMADSIEQAQMEADVLAYQNIKIERKQNGGMYLDDMLDSDTADIIREQLKQKIGEQGYGADIREQLKQKIGEQGYGADLLANNTTPARESVARQGYSLDALLEDTLVRDKNLDELEHSGNKESDKDDLESLSTDELASLLRGEMNDLDISLKQDMPELNKSLDINNYRPKE